MEKILLESVSKYMNKNKVTGTSQHGLTKMKSCLTKLRPLYNEDTGKWKDSSGCFLPQFSKVFGSISHNNIINKMTKLDK